MTRNVASCAPNTVVEDAAALMVKSDCGALPVIDPQTRKAVGVITDRDIVARAVAERRNPLGMKVDELMTMPIMAVRPDTSLGKCLTEMEQAQVRRMLVLDDGGRLCGIVSQADIARSAPEHETAELVKDVSMPTVEPAKSSGRDSKGR